MYVDADDIGDGQWVKGRYVSVRYVYMYICMYLGGCQSDAIYGLTGTTTAKTPANGSRRR